MKQFAGRSLIVWIGIPLTVLVITALSLGPHVVANNRMDELLTEARQVVAFKAFDDYQAIYSFFKSIEDEPPFSGFSKSLPAIVRHWMPLIYLIGLLEYFVKQLFPIFLLPLMVAGGHYLRSESRNTELEKKFILLTWLVYMLLILYFFIVRDFIQGRFLFTPAVLLYPWVGFGITLILRWLESRRFTRPLQIALVAALVVSPCVKSARAVFSSDLALLEAGRFIANDAELADARILFSDSRLWLYGQGTDSYTNIIQPTKIASRYIQESKVEAIEELALQREADAIALSINFNRTDTIPRFEHYVEFNRFPGRKGVTVIYKRIRSIQNQLSAPG